MDDYAKITDANADNPLMSPADISSPTVPPLVDNYNPLEQQRMTP